jgi:hypothetical protein
MMDEFSECESIRRDNPKTSRESLKGNHAKGLIYRRENEDIEFT